MIATVATCASCHARIVWALSTTGRPMPFDAEPAAGGTFVLTRTVDHKLFAVSVHTDDARPRYVSHFATCPDAAQHRKPRVAKGA